MWVPAEEGAAEAEAEAEAEAATSVLRMQNPSQAHPCLHRLEPRIQFQKKTATLTLAEAERARPP